MLEMTLQIPTVIGRVMTRRVGGGQGRAGGQEGKEGSWLIDVGEVVEAEVCKYDKPRHANPSAVVTFFSRYSAGSSHVFVILLLTNNLRSYVSRRCERNHQKRGIGFRAGLEHKLEIDKYFQN